MDPAERNKKCLIINVIRFLQKEARDSSPDKRESIEVAMQCLESAFDIDYERDRGDSDPQDLLTIFSRSLPIVSQERATPQLLAEAEACKNKGNELMRNGLYKEAVEHYTRAIQINPENAVFFCNRAAAFSRLENHESVIRDCEQAVKLDPTYGKAYGRLGIAYSNLNMHKKAKDAYQRAVILDPTNSMYQENLKLAEERLLSSFPGDEAASMDPASVDLGQFMNNPSLLNMASQMLNDPGVRDVMSGILQMGNEGGNPNIDTLLQMGQQLAEQMQINNPGFVDNLRRQFTGDRPAESDADYPDSDPTNPKRDEPPGSNGDDSTS